MNAVERMNAWQREGGEHITGLDWYSVAERSRGFSSLLSGSLVEIDDPSFYLLDGRRVTFDEESRRWGFDGDWTTELSEMIVVDLLELYDWLIGAGMYGLAVILRSEYLQGVPLP